MFKVFSVISLILDKFRTCFYSFIAGNKFRFIGKRVVLNIQGAVSFGKNITINDGVTIVVEKNAKLILGDNVFLGENCYIKCYGGKIEIGNDVSINSKSFINGAGGVYIGSNTRIGTQTIIIASNHNFSNPEVLIKDQGTSCEGIYIGENIWLGARVTVLDGSEIKSKSVIGACGLVNKKLDEPGVYVGIPAKLKKTI